MNDGTDDDGDGGGRSGRLCCHHGCGGDDRLGHHGNMINESIIGEYKVDLR